MRREGRSGRPGRRLNEREKRSGTRRGKKNEKETVSAYGTEIGSEIGTGKGIESAIAKGTGGRPIDAVVTMTTHAVERGPGSPTKPYQKQRYLRLRSNAWKKKL